ncbi:MAG: zf-HC2 domain-containing protein [Gemmatimonadaceae bacterium]
MTLPPIDCRHAMRELWDYLDDELPAYLTQQIREHLATCVGCQDHVQFCRAFLAQIEMTPVSQSDVSTLREKLQGALQRDGLTVINKT